MSKEIFDKLQLEVTYYGITDEDLTLIELTIHNYKQIIRIEDEDKYSLASTFDKQTYLLDALLLSIYSKVYSERTISKRSFFSPIEFLCSEQSFEQIKEFVESAGFNDSFKFVFGDEKLLKDEEDSVLYRLVDEGKLLQKGFMSLHDTSNSLEEDYFSVKTVTFSTSIPEDERYPEGFNREDIVKVEDTRKVTIPYVDIY